MTTIPFKELGEQYSAEHYDHVSVTLNGKEEDTIWQRTPDADGSPLPDEKPVPVLRMLNVIASKSDNIRERLEELGYSSEGFFD